MSLPAEQPRPGGDAAVRDGRDPRSWWSTAVDRHRRCILLLLAASWLFLAVGTVETVVESSRTALVVVGTLAGVALGAYGAREVPTLDDAADWFAVTPRPAAPTSGARRGGAWRIVRALVAGAAVLVAFAALFLVEPLPTSFARGLGIVFIGVMLIRSWRTPSRAPA